MDKITSGDITALFEALHATFRDKRDELIALDAKVGDSDLGITMSKGFAAARDASPPRPIPRWANSSCWPVRQWQRQPRQPWGR